MRPRRHGSRPSGPVGCGSGHLGAKSSPPANTQRFPVNFLPTYTHAVTPSTYGYGPEKHGLGPVWAGSIPESCLDSVRCRVTTQIYIQRSLAATASVFLQTLWQVSLRRQPLRSLRVEKRQRSLLRCCFRIRDRHGFHRLANVEGEPHRGSSSRSAKGQLKRVLRSGPAIGSMPTGSAR